MSSIFFFQPPDPPRPIPDPLWALIALVGGLVVGASFHDPSTAAIAGILSCIAIWAVPAMRLRWQVISVLHDVSASRAHDRFLQIAVHITGSVRHARRYWPLLRQIAERRKHPNATSLRDIEESMTVFSKDTVSQARQFAQTILEAKARLRANAITALHAFLRKELKEKSTIILYGFSTVVCDALAGLQPLPWRVIVIADQQYGGASHREHERVMRRLRAHSKNLRLIPFSQAAQYLSGKQAIDLDGSALKLAGGPNVVLLGCEAYATDGTVLIPAQTDDAIEDTAALMAVLRRMPGALRKRVHLVIVGEAYKLRRGFVLSDTNVTAPLLFSAWGLFRLAVYLLTGREASLRLDKVKLVRVPPSDVRAIVDDAGTHVAPWNSTLEEAQRTWSRMLRATRGPDDPGFAGTCDAYILDLNGVLANDEHLHQAAFVELVSEHGETLTQAQYAQACQGRSDREGVERLIDLGRLTGDPATLVTRKQAKYRAFSAGAAKPYRHAPELVRQLVALGKRVYLVTSSSSAEAQRFVADAGLATVLNGESIYSDVTSATRASTYQQIIAATGLDARSIVVVDDSPANLRMAQTLRMRTIGVETTRPDDIRADQVVRDADDLFNMIKARPVY